ncbi:unnamed protein product, partial [Symbiodinium pilosum]
AVPDLAVRQIFGKQKLPENLRLLMADSSLLSIERIAMLGDTISQAKTTLKAIVNDDTKFGADNRSRAVSHFAGGEDHAEFRETFVSAHPDVILTYMREPHRKFVERIYRDYMVHGSVSYYEVAEMRTRSDRLVQTTGFSKTSDLLKVVQHDNKAAIAAESDVLDRLHAFFVALEYLNICDFTFAA